MRIVHIDETFHPSFGYQINSLAKYQKKEGNEVFILTTDEKHLHPAFLFSSDNERILEFDKNYEQATGVKIIRIPVKRYISNRAVFTNELFKELSRLKPDVVMLHQIETYASLVYILKGLYKKYPTVADSHMLRMASQNKLAKLFNALFKATVRKRLIKNGISVVRTQDDDYVNTVLGIPKVLTPFVSFGSDLTLFHPDIEVRKQFRSENGIADDAFVVVYTGKMDFDKGGKILADAASMEYKTGDREVVFVIVGNTYNDKYGKSVEKSFASSKNRIIRFPTQKFIDLPKFYQAADLSVFARQCSLSFYDAQACGLPVVSEDNNVNTDRLSHNNGLVFKSGDAEDFKEKIEYFANLDKEEYAKYAENSEKFIRSSYGYDKIAEEYTLLMQKAIDNKKK